MVGQVSFEGVRLYQLRQLKRATLAVQAEDEAAERERRKLQAAIDRHPCRRVHKAIGAAVQRGDMAEAGRLLAGAPERYRAVFWLCRWAARQCGP